MGEKQWNRKGNERGRNKKKQKKIREIKMNNTITMRILQNMTLERIREKDSSNMKCLFFLGFCYNNLYDMRK